jgi:16S rRNA processing protein RimM
MSFSGETEHFFKLERIILKDKDLSRSFEVEEVKPNGDQLLMKLKGIDTPEEGKLYSRWEIWVPRELASPCEENEFYHADLIGCKLMMKGEVLGSVRSIMEGGGDDLLEIIMNDGETKIVPFNAVFIGPIDTDKKEIELLEGWILD